MSSLKIARQRTNLTIQSNDNESKLDYKSGASYNGKVQDNLKYGNGTFIWPNGDKYLGEFKSNYRHGFGN